MSLVVTYPNVPQASGVPPVLRQVSQIGQDQDTALLLVADALVAIRQFFPPAWGLYASGSFFPALTINSNVELGFRREHRITTAQQEQGAFMSYDKVEMPYEGRLTVNASGLTQISTLLSELKSIQENLLLYTLVMPEFSYPNMNVVHHDFTRSQRHGAYLLTVDIWLEQVRIAQAPQFTNTASPSGANSLSSGTVQPQTPSASTLGGLNLDLSNATLT